MTSENERKQISRLREQVVKNTKGNQDLRTECEKMKEQLIHDKAMKIGINLKMTDSSETENNYRNLALLYILEGKEVLEELLEKIKLEDQKASNQMG